MPYRAGVEEGPKARRVLALLVAGEAIAVVALHRLGGVDGFAMPRHDVARWLQQTPSEDVLLAGVRLAALVAAWWLLGSTLLYVAARVARLHGTAAALGWATLPAVRRWADRAAAVSIVAATALGVGRPAAADPPPPASPTTAPVVLDADHRDPVSVPSASPVERAHRTTASIRPRCRACRRWIPRRRLRRRHRRLRHSLPPAVPIAPPAPAASPIAPNRGRDAHRLPR